jgi:signal transduction histidine kinase
VDRVTSLFRVSAAVLLFAVLTLVASGLVRARETDDPPRELPADPILVVEAFERTHRPEHEVDLGTRYAGRLELVDAKMNLPTWHLHPYAEAKAVFAATRQCPPSRLAEPLADAALAKAYAWHARTCASPMAAAEELVDSPPFVHPSGKTYAALAFARSSDKANFVARHERAFHVLELGAMAPGWLGDDGRALRTMGPLVWESLSRGDRIALAEDTLVRVEHGANGLERLRFHSRKAWEKEARSASVRLVPRLSKTACTRPAESTLCWQPLSPSERHRERFVVVTGTAGAVAVLAAFALGLAYLLERRRLHADRIHVLRTLTHELRTPAMSLGLDIEPLNTAYDDLPTSCQEPVLRLSDGIARLNRVLHRSAKYMALFETNERGLTMNVTRLPSVAETLRELSDEWPEEASLVCESEDGAFATDVEWLGVAVRNLVENGFRHGTPPVIVHWKLGADELVLRVTDAGTSPTFSLRRAIEPYHRDPRSPGLGLGLAIVARVARLLGGKLTHSPSPTTFELRLPSMPSSKSTPPLVPLEGPS